MVFSPRGNITVLQFDIKFHGSTPDLGNSAKTPRISPAHWKLRWYHWPAHWVLGINGIPQSIWMLILNPLNRKTLPILLGFGFMLDSWMFLLSSLAESGWYLRILLFKNNKHVVRRNNASAHPRLHVSCVWGTKFSTWEVFFPACGCINELADVRGDGAIT